LQIDVVPGEAGDLTATHPGRDEQQPGGVQPVAMDVGDEGAELIR
jgi:hypothetical protein